MLEQTGVQNPPQPQPPAASGAGGVSSPNDGKLNLPNMKKMGGHKIDVGETAVSSIYFAIGALVAAVAVTGFLMYSKSSTILAVEQVKEQYRSEVETQLNDELFIAQKDQVVEVGSQIDLLKQSLTGRLLFTKVLDDIQSKTYKQTRYKTVMMSDTGDIEVTGSVTQFVDMAKAIAALRNLTTVADWELTNVNINSEEKTVEYTVRGKIQVDLIKPITQSSTTSKTTGTTSSSSTINAVSGTAETTSSPLGN